jgi:dihydrofolate reductase
MTSGVSIILACTHDGGIGKNNAIPWSIPADMKHFKDITTTAPHGFKNVVIMGKNTWLSLPNEYKPLQNRINIIVSSTLHEHKNNIEIKDNLDEAINYAMSLDKIFKVFVIGGARLYNEIMKHPLCTTAYVTHIMTGEDTMNIDCDTFIDLDTFNNIFTLTKEGIVNRKDHLYFTFCEYHKVSQGIKFE